jgi:hypothetical protein
MTCTAVKHTFACGHPVPDSATNQVKETSPHWLCTSCAIMRQHPNATEHGWTEEEIYFDRRRNLTASGWKTVVLETSWRPQSEANPTLHYRWIAVPP